MFYIETASYSQLERRMRNNSLSESGLVHLDSIMKILGPLTSKFVPADEFRRKASEVVTLLGDTGELSSCGAQYYIGERLLAEDEDWKLLTTCIYGDISA